MKRQIMLEINAGKKTCQSCEFAHGMFCDIFKSRLTLINYILHRLPICKELETTHERLENANKEKIENETETKNEKTH